MKAGLGPPPRDLPPGTLYYNCSRLTTLESCQQEYVWRYRDKLVGSTDSALALELGSLCHGIREGKTEEAESTYVAAIPEAYQAEWLQWLAWAKVTMARHAEFWVNDEREKDVLGYELEAWLLVDGVCFMAILDELFVSDGELGADECKTFSSRVSPAERIADFDAAWQTMLQGAIVSTLAKDGFVVTHGPRLTSGFLPDLLSYGGVRFDGIQKRGLPEPPKPSYTRKDGVVVHRSAEWLAKQNAKYRAACQNFDTDTFHRTRSRPHAEYCRDQLRQMIRSADYAHSLECGETLYPPARAIHATPFICNKYNRRCIFKDNCIMDTEPNPFDFGQREPDYVDRAREASNG